MNGLRGTAAQARRARTGAVARPLLCCLAALSIATCAHARDDPRPLFESGTTLAVTVEAPWQELVRRKDEERRHPAALAYTDAAGHAHRIAATVEPRGLTRLRICRFPPLRIRFARDAADGSDFEGQRSLKMVTHCRNGAGYEQYYVGELLAYRIYNLFTEHSFRVRPLSVTYRDSANGREDGPRFAFLVEDLGEVGKRTGRKRSPAAEFAPGDFDPLALTRFMMFQYLIGNTDFEVLSGPQDDECCHNVRVTALRDGDGPLLALPYDFDSSGMVDASYAAPHERLPIRSVTQRLYRGFCRHGDALQAVRAEFLGKRDAVLALVDGEPRLSPERRRDTRRYFEEFFAILGDDGRFAREVSGTCRK